MKQYKHGEAGSEDARQNFYDIKNPEVIEEEDAHEKEDVQKDSEEMKGVQVESMCSKEEFVSCPDGKWIQTENVNSWPTKNMPRVKCPGPPTIGPCP